MEDRSEVIIFGGGCFWCTEAVFKLFKGVISTAPGYAGGTTENPTYEEVCAGTTGHAEALRVEYDPDIMPFDTLLEIFFTMHDPTQKDRQGADFGTQYRSIILYTTDFQKDGADRFIKRAQSEFGKLITTEVKKLVKFYPAELYHKNYYDKNPLAPYCLLVISPKVKKLKEKFKALLKDQNR